MPIPKLYDVINFDSNININDAINESMSKWLEKNLSTTGLIKKHTTKLEIYVDEKKTGWFIDSDNYTEVQGIGYTTTPFAKLQCYSGYEDGLAIIS